MKVNRILWRWSRLIHVHAAISLLILLAFFAFTGFTLNHPDWFPGEARQTDIHFELNHFHASQGLTFSPLQIHQLEEKLNLRFSQINMEQDESTVFIDAQMPGSFLSGEIDLTTGSVDVSYTRFGIAAMLNDLHKGRHSGLVWSLVLDFSALLILLFCFTGLVLLLPNKRYFKSAIFIGLGTAVSFAFFISVIL